MKFKFINVSINLPDDTTVERSQEIEGKIKDFTTGLGLTGSIGFDVQDDIGTPAVKTSAKAA